MTGPGDIKMRGILGSLQNPYPGGAALPDAIYGELPGFDLAFRTEVLAGNVPEPASWAMLISGFGLVGAL